jgi:hypothetical protein
MSAVMRVELIGDRMSYVTFKSHWCDVIVLNVHVPTEDKTDVMKSSFCEELERLLDQFQKYNMNVLL